MLKQHENQHQHWPWDPQNPDKTCQQPVPSGTEWDMKSLSSLRWWASLLKANLPPALAPEQESRLHRGVIIHLLQTSSSDTTSSSQTFHSFPKALSAALGRAVPGVLSDIFFSLTGISTPGCSGRCSSPGSPPQAWERPCGWMAAGHSIGKCWRWCQAEIPRPPSHTPQHIPDTSWGSALRYPAWCFY